jgi:hypothetical protein
MSAYRGQFRVVEIVQSHTIPGTPKVSDEPEASCAGANHRHRRLFLLTLHGGVLLPVYALSPCAIKTPVACCAAHGAQLS